MPGCLLYIKIGNASNLNILFHGLKIVSLLFFLCERKIEKNLLCNKSTLFVILYGCCITLSNLIHGGNWLELRIPLFFGGFAILISYYFKKHYIPFINSFVILFGLYNCLQLITVFCFYPYGITHYNGNSWEETLASAIYFLGGKNQAIYYMLFFLFFITLKNYLKSKKIMPSTYLWTGIFIVESLILESSNSLVCLIMFLIVIILLHLHVNRYVKNLFNPYILFAGCVFLFAIICVFSKTDDIKVFKIILKILGKSTTFTNRSFIWNEALNLFISNPLFGAGEILMPVKGSLINQAHNVYFDIMYKYGIGAILIYLILIWRNIPKLNLFKHTDIGVLYIGLLSISLVHNCFDAMDNFIFILMICLYDNVHLLTNYSLKKGLSDERDRYC